MLESKIQSKIIAHLRKNTNYITLNVSNVNMAGFPDILVLSGSNTFCIEVKQKGKKPRPLQLWVMKQLESVGIKCYVMDEFDVEKLTKFVKC